MTVPAQAAPASSTLASSVAAAEDTQAVTCGNAYWPHGNYDTGSGKVTVSSAAVHTGPYGACTTVGSVSQGTTVYYDCYVVNDYGNTWTWIRDGNGSSLGWIYDAYLDDNGATVGC
ncbi:SH3 domain-containing protein [Streptomyces sp. SID1328]|uniref:SH3 domain-containing protein n=1 Tax=Streptomyces sp. SID1328 TaxID=2690250 RepID=UPI001928782C|nr:SH3 domain-containing protein [Streptomyces sp. SID1328]